MSRRSTTETIYLIIEMMETYRSRRRDICIVIIDLEKPYDQVPRYVLWRALEKKGDSTLESIGKERSESYKY